jgi:hypothetical protein
MFRKPKYFVAIFGGKRFATYPVDGGAHFDYANQTNSSGITAGDIVLLYCCKNYPGHYSQFPGLGVVTDIKTSGGFNYQYLPFYHPIPVDWDTMKVAIPELAPPGNRIWRNKVNWLRQISSSSFRATIAGRKVDWP